MAATVTGTLHDASNNPLANFSFTIIPKSFPVFIGGVLFTEGAKVWTTNSSGFFSVTLTQGTYVLNVFSPLVIVVPSSGTVDISTISQNIPIASTAIQEVNITTTAELAGILQNTTDIDFNEQGDGNAIPLVFGIVGNLGEGELAGSTNGIINNQLAVLFNSWNVNEILSLGDQVHSDNQTANYDAALGPSFQSFMFPYTGSYGSGSVDSINHFWPCPGETDWNDVTNSDDDLNGYNSYFQCYSLSGQPFFNTNAYGKLTFPLTDGTNVDVFYLDSDSNEPDGTSSSSTQGQWLQSQLASSTARWKLVYFHHAPYCSQSGYSQPQMQWPFASWGAHAVLASHAEIYERLEVDGIPYFVVGDVVNSTQVVSAAVVTGGSGYTVGDVLTLLGGIGTSAQVTVAAVSSGSITSVSVSTPGSYTIVPSNPVSTTDNITFSSIDLIDGGSTNFANSDTLSVGGTTYTFKTSISVANDILIGAAFSDTLFNLQSAILALSGIGTTYGTGTTLNANATMSYSGGSTATFTALTGGTGGNSLTLTVTTGISLQFASPSGGTPTTLVTATPVSFSGGGGTGTVATFNLTFAGSGISLGSPLGTSQKIYVNAASALQMSITPKSIRFRGIDVYGNCFDDVTLMSQNWPNSIYANIKIAPGGGLKMTAKGLAIDFGNADNQVAPETAYDASIGGTIVSATAPDVASKPKLAGFFWVSLGAQPMICSWNRQLKQWIDITQSTSYAYAPSEPAFNTPIFTPPDGNVADGVTITHPDIGTYPSLVIYVSIDGGDFTTVTNGTTVIFPEQSKRIVAAYAASVGFIDSDIVTGHYSESTTTDI